MTDKQKQIEELEKELEEIFDEEYNRGYEPCGSIVAERLYDAGYRKQTEEILNAIDSFKNALMDKFLMLCNYNDYSRLNLLKIDETVSDVFNEQILRILKGGESDA